MKKIIVTILAFLYLFASAGATVHIHFCMNKQVEWDFFENQSDTCSKCGMDKKDTDENGCCKDVQKHIKIDKDQKTSESLKQFKYQLSSPAPHSFYELKTNDFTIINELAAISHAPPQSSRLAIYIQNCVFLI